MAQRKVFGRRKVTFDGQQFTLEMRADGIFVRRKHCRDEWRLPFEKLLNHARQQPELFYDDKRQPEMFKDPVGPSDPNAPLPDLQQVDVVPNQPGGEHLPVHEAAVQQGENTEVGRPWVDSSPVYEEKLSPFISPSGTNLAPIPLLQETDGSLEQADNPSGSPTPGQPTGPDPEITHGPGDVLVPGAPIVGLPHDGRL